jgi:hypothetical protein
MHEHDGRFHNVRSRAAGGRRGGRRSGRQAVYAAQDDDKHCYGDKHDHGHSDRDETLTTAQLIETTAQLITVLSSSVV